MNVIKTLLCLLILIFSIVNCSDSEEASSKSTMTVTATANGIRHSDGAITIDSDAKISPEMNERFEKRFEINKQYPAEHPPKEAKLYTVKKVISGDTILLNDGTSVRLVGVMAPNKTKMKFNAAISEKFKVPTQNIHNYELLSREYLQRLLNEETISYVIHSKLENGQIAGYLWIVDDFLMKDPDLKGFITSPSYSCVNETVITSGWCFADKDSKHKLLEKYLILQDHAVMAEVGMWEKGS